MEDNVRINVVGIQSDMAENEAIELQTTGKWYRKNNKDYIVYTDHQFDDTRGTKTRVTVDGDMVSIIRSGSTNTHLIFETNVSHIIPYETPFGILDMVSSTKSIEHSFTSDSVEIKVTYNLEVNHTDMGTNVFHLTATKIV